LIHLDTSFMVDLLRERASSREGPATHLLTGPLGGEELAISVHVACELHAGAELADRPSQERGRVQALCAALQVRFPDQAFAPLYGRLLADLRRAGHSISAMDLPIAVAALMDESPLVTRNVKDFQRVPGLELVGY
jgi:tRNA(fMet)-specific endonuclease VapC